MQPLSTGKHTKSIARHEGKGSAFEKQPYMIDALEDIEKLCQFNMDLCVAPSAANIRLNKLENPRFKRFFENYGQCAAV